MYLGLENESGECLVDEAEVDLFELVAPLSHSLSKNGARLRDALVLEHAGAVAVAVCANNGECEVVLVWDSFFTMRVAVEDFGFGKMILKSPLKNEVVGVLLGANNDKIAIIDVFTGAKTIIPFDNRPRIECIEFIGSDDSTLMIAFQSGDLEIYSVKEDTTIEFFSSLKLNLKTKETIQYMVSKQNDSIIVMLSAFSKISRFVKLRRVDKKSFILDQEIDLRTNELRSLNFILTKKEDIVFVTCDGKLFGEVKFGSPPSMIFETNEKIRPGIGIVSCRDNILWTSNTNRQILCKRIS